MAQRTETDLRELTDLVKGLVAKIENVDNNLKNLERKVDQGFSTADKKIEALSTKIEAIDKKVNELDKKIEVGFTDVNGKFDLLNNRTGAVETSIKVLDARLWTFIGITVSATLASLLAIFTRYLFSNDPKF